MKEIFNFTIKNLQANKKRTLVTIIGIVLSCILLFSVGLFFSTYREYLIKEVKSQVGNYHIEYQNIPYSKLDIINEDYNVDHALIKIRHILNGKIANDEYHINIEVCSLNTNYNQFLNIIYGTVPKNSEEVIISEYFAHKQNLNIGESITIISQNKENKYKIVGIYKSQDLYSNYYYSIYDLEVMYTFFSADENLNVDVFVTLNSTKHGIAKLQLLTEKLELPFPNLELTNSNQHVNVNTQLLALYGEITDKGIYAVLYLSAMLILTVLSLVCILIIKNSFDISLAERKKVFGILSSIGTTPKQLLYSIFIEAGIISLIAIPFGFILSLFSVSLVLTILNKILEDILINQLVVVVYPYYILLSLSFILITIFLSTLFPAVRASEVSPIEAILLNNDIKIKRKKVKTNNLIHKIFGIEGSIAYKNFKRNKKRYRTTIISLVASIVLFITTSTYINGGLKILKNSYTSLPYDFIITISEGEGQKEFIEEIKNLSEITDVLEYKYQRFFFEKHDLSVFEQDYLNFVNNRYDPNMRVATVFLLSDESYQKYKKRINLKTEQPIFINYGVYAQLNKDNEIEDKYEGPPYKENPNLTFRFCNFEDYPKNEKISDCYFELSNLYFTNIAPFDNYNFYSTFIVNSKMFDEMNKKRKKDNNFFVSENSTTLELKIKNAKKFDAELRKILDKYSNLSFSYQNPKLEFYENQMIQLAVSFTLYSLSTFIALIAITSVINTINTSINLRKIEFAIFKSVGQSSKSLNKMIMLENLFLGFKVLIYGLIISFGIIHIIMSIADLSYGENKIKIPFPTLSIIISIMATFIIIFLTTKYSINKLKKENIIDVIRNQNI